MTYSVFRRGTASCALREYKQRIMTHLHNDTREKFCIVMQMMQPRSLASKRTKPPANKEIRGGSLPYLALSHPADAAAQRTLERTLERTLKTRRSSRGIRRPISPFPFRAVCRRSVPLRVGRDTTRGAVRAGDAGNEVIDIQGISVRGKTRTKWTRETRVRLVAIRSRVARREDEKTRRRERAARWRFSSISTHEFGIGDRAIPHSP